MLTEFWTSHFKRYVEPFAGSASFFFELQPGRSILADLNNDLISTYKAIREDPLDVVSQLATFGSGSDEYYRLRSITTVGKSPAFQAARFIYLNRYCFNGLYRTNRKGEFNVPYGGGKTGALPSASVLQAASYALQQTKLHCCDFEEVLDKTTRGDFVYLDPPYQVAAVRTFNEYTQAPFSHEDLFRLRACIERMSVRGVRFVLSYANCEESSILTRGFDRADIVVRRNVAGFGGHRRMTSEILVTNCSGQSKCALENRV